MVETKDKNVTVESMKALHDYNVATYMLNANPVGTGSLSVNRKKDTNIGSYSTAIGYETTASGLSSYAEGFLASASGKYSHAQGYITEASGVSSHSEGEGTISASHVQHVQGKYNIVDVDEEGSPLNTYAHIVGNGNGNNRRSNAHTLTWEGDAWYAGDFSADGNIILSSNQYGDTLPDPGTVGRIFFKKLSE